MLDDYIDIRNISWTLRIQEVYNHALSVRTAAGKPVHIMAGGPFTAVEVMVAEAGTAKSGVRNLPFWP